MCIFCDVLNNKIESYKLYEDELCLVLLDVNPVTKGHSLVLPKQHFETLLDIDEATLAHLTSIIKKYAALIKDKTGCTGFNILSNNFESAGQTIDHLHFHIIPRYTVHDAIKIEFSKQLSNEMEQTYHLLKN